MVNDKGEPAKAGYLVLTKPWPGMLRGIYRDPQRFVAQYWSRYPGIYFTGDGAKLDEDGYFWLLGRVDDVMNVSGHRVSTMEVESALVDHPKRRRGRGDRAAARDQGPGHRRLRHHQGRQPGHQGADGGDQGPRRRRRSARWPGPTTSSSPPTCPRRARGKIMRRLLRDIAEGKALGDTTTLADPTVVARLKDQYGEEE